MCEYYFKFFWTQLFYKTILSYCIQYFNSITHALNKVAINLTINFYNIFFSWLFLALSILFTISPSLVKNQSLTSLSNLPIGKILWGYLMKSMTLLGSTFLSVVQTIPTGLLKAKYMFLGLLIFSILWPPTSTRSLSSTLEPISGILPLMVTFLQRLIYLLLEQNWLA